MAGKTRKYWVGPKCEVYIFTPIPFAQNFDNTNQNIITSIPFCTKLV